jgi:hypothetical protein
MSIKNSLPSKKFVLVILIACAGVLLILFASTFFGAGLSYQNKQDLAKPATEKTLGEIINLDSNNNGIPDWEEKLWGLDPKGSGTANKKIIDAKKTAANIDTSATAPDESLTETAKFSRELLTTVVALRENGSLTPDTLANLGNSLSIDIAGKRTTTPPYTESDITMTSDSPLAYKTYRAQFKQVVAQYGNSGIGTELDVITAGLEASATTDSLDSLDPIANTYINFGKKIIALKTPPDAVPMALAFANKNVLIGNALLKTERLYTDAMVGIVGIDEYVQNIDSYGQTSADVVSYFSTKDRTLGQ